MENKECNQCKKQLKQIKDLNAEIVENKKKINELQLEIAELGIELCAMSSMLDDLTGSELIFGTLEEEDG